MLFQSGSGLQFAVQTLLLLCPSSFPFLSPLVASPAVNRLSPNLIPQRWYYFAYLCIAITPILWFVFVICGVGYYFGCILGVLPVNSTGENKKMLMLAVNHGFKNRTTDSTFLFFEIFDQVGWFWSMVVGKTLGPRVFFPTTNNDHQPEQQPQGGGGGMGVGWNPGPRTYIPPFHFRYF